MKSQPPPRPVTGSISIAPAVNVSWSAPSSFKPSIHPTVSTTIPIPNRMNAFRSLTLLSSDITLPYRCNCNQGRREEQPEQTPNDRCGSHRLLIRLCEGSRDLH